MRLLISLCVIARDEERMLPACLASAAGVVDEIVLVDTGSRDRTVEIARAAGARILEQPWQDDFSAPRNLAVEHARGAWVLQLDADERLVAGGGPRLRAAVDAGSFDCGMVRCHNASRLDAAPEDVVAGRARVGPSTLLPRVLRRTPDLRYSGIVHESVSDWVARRGMRVSPLDVDVVHLGAIAALRRDRGKDERNLRLLRQRCVVERDSITPFGYLALELVSRGALAEAGDAVARGWALLPSRPADVSVLRLAVARGIGALEGGDPERALESVDLAERIEGPQPDLHHLRGRACLSLAARAGPPEREQLLAVAESAFRAALGFPPGAALRQYVAGASSWASRNGLGEVMLRRGRHADAIAAFREVVADWPENLDAAYGEVEALLGAGEPAAALARVERLLADDPDGWLLAALAARALGARGDAALLAKQAARRRGRRFRAPHRSELLVEVARELGIAAA